MHAHTAYVCIHAHIYTCTHVCTQTHAHTQKMNDFLNCSPDGYEGVRYVTTALWRPRQEDCGLEASLGLTLQNQISLSHDSMVTLHAGATFHTGGVVASWEQEARLGSVTHMDPPHPCDLCPLCPEAQSGRHKSLVGSV